MHALVKAHAAPGIELQEIARPTVGINDVMIRVKRTGICGTDLHIYNWDALGAEDDSGADGGRSRIRRRDRRGRQRTCPTSRSGDRSSAARAMSFAAIAETVCAGRRHLCSNTAGVGVNRPGCFAEYLVSLPMTNVWQHCRRRSTDELRRFSIRSATQCTRHLRSTLLGEDVLITGAGPIGIMAAAIVRIAGARHVVITDVNHYRLELARKMGATLAAECDNDEFARRRRNNSE